MTTGTHDCQLLKNKLQQASLQWRTINWYAPTR